MTKKRGILFLFLGIFITIVIVAFFSWSKYCDMSSNKIKIHLEQYEQCNFFAVYDEYVLYNSDDVFIRITKAMKEKGHGDNWSIFHATREYIYISSYTGEIYKTDYNFSKIDLICDISAIHSDAYKNISKIEFLNEDIIFSSVSSGSTLRLTVTYSFSLALVRAT